MEDSEAGQGAQVPQRRTRWQGRQLEPTVVWKRLTRTTADRNSLACKKKELQSVITHVLLTQQDSLCGAKRRSVKIAHVVRLQGPKHRLRPQLVGERTVMSSCATRWRFKEGSEDSEVAVLSIIHNNNIIHIFLLRG